jgi:hypothetical protein
MNNRTASSLQRLPLLCSAGVGLITLLYLLL